MAGAIQAGNSPYDVIDFEDVLLYTVGLIADHRQVADAVRGQYHHLVVDEYQDVSPLQQTLLDQWLGERRSVCVVGDPNQTIYTFAGASPRFLLDFRRRYPDAGEVRLVHLNCMATLGQVGNVDHENIVIGKAGRNRHRGRRPTVRGSVMNPRDHPHGGGEGKAPIGGQPKTKWGKPAFQRTRNSKRTDSMIVRRRPQKRR